LSTIFSAYKLTFKDDESEIFRWLNIKFIIVRNENL